MAAIGSNEGRYGYTDVVLELAHTDASKPRAVPSSERSRTPHGSGRCLGRLQGHDEQWPLDAVEANAGRLLADSF